MGNDEEETKLVHRDATEDGKSVLMSCTCMCNARKWETHAAKFRNRTNRLSCIRPVTVHGSEGCVTYILDDHNQERQLDAKSLLGVGRTLDVSCANIGTHDL